MSMFRPRRLLGTAALVAVVALAACDPSNPVGHGPAPVSAASPSTAPATALARPTKVLTIVVENHSLDEMRRQMPYSYGLAQRFAYASGYSAITHPSLPNYLAMAGGSIFGVHDDAGPSVHPLEGPSVFDSALAAGKTARVYAEAMTSNCSTKSTGRYAVKHNPWAYFTQGRAACAAHDVPAGTVAAGALHDDIANGTLPNAGMLIPDVCDDGHDCPLSTADHYLAGWLTPILAG
ncbi:MAG: phosphoesterase, partial [Acidimicrobiia bacterium]|nr:phosphoesterase [Acidimicrobiia bacterium]